MRMLMCALVCSALLMGCGGGGTTTTPPTPTPQAQVNGIVPSQALDANTPGYAGDTLTIRATVQGTLVTIAWDFGGGATPDDAMTLAPVVELGAPGAYHGRVTVTDANGLTDAFAFDFTVRDPSFRIHDFVPAGTVGQLGEVVQLSAQVDGTVTDWLWSTTGGELAIADVESPFVKWTAAGDQTVTVQVTLDDATILTRDFTVTVAPTNWQLAFEQGWRSVIDTLVLSDGSIGLLLLGASAQYSFMHSMGSDLASPNAWTEHPFGLTSAKSYGDLAESDGRLAAIYTAGTGGGYGGGPSGQIGVIAFTESLSPASTSDWLYHVATEGSGVQQVAVTGVPGDGWRVLYSESNNLKWASTSIAKPSDSDQWTRGTLQAGQGSASLFLGLSDGKLIGALDHVENKILLGPSTDIALLGTAGTYALPGVQGTWSMQDGHLVAMLSDFNTFHVSAAVATTMPPLSLADWTIFPTGINGSPNSATVHLSQDQIAILIQQRVGPVTHDFGQAVLLTQPLSTTPATWQRDFITDTTIQDPFILPDDNNLLLGYANSNVTSRFLHRMTP